MTASEKAKSAGFKNLAELSRISGASSQTLNNWFSDKPFIFESVLMSAVLQEKKEKQVQRKQFNLSKEKTDAIFSIAKAVKLDAERDNEYIETKEVLNLVDDFFNDRKNRQRVRDAIACCRF